MDTRLESALELSKSLETIENQKALAYSKYQQNQILYYQGGTFVADTALLAAVLSLKSLDLELILIDINKIPISIGDADEFVFMIQSKIAESSRQYLADYESIKKIRTPKGILEK